MDTHHFGFKKNAARNSGARPLEYFGGPDPDDRSEWKYFTGAKIRFICPEGKFQLALMLIHPATGEVLPLNAVSPFEPNVPGSEITKLASRPDKVPLLIDGVQKSLFATDEVTVRTPQSVGLTPTGTGLVARYRYAVVVVPENGEELILDTSQTGEWDHGC